MSRHATIDPELLRNAMRRWVTGVTIVTSNADGSRFGMTVNSFNSVSLDPPMIAVTLAKDTRTFHLVESSAVFGVTVLGGQQEQLSNRFAGRIPEIEDRFAGLETFTMETGAPFIKGGESFLDCQVVHRFEAGHNMLFVGLVVAASISAEGSPLVYYQRRYWNLADPAAHPESG